MAKSISNSEDIIDSRDVIARIEELQGELDGLIESAREDQEALQEAVDEMEAGESLDDEEGRREEASVDRCRKSLSRSVDALAEWIGCHESDVTDWLEDGKSIEEAWKGYDLLSDEAEELKALLELANEGENESDWTHGATLIRETYFEDYAKELARDLGEIDGTESWPLNCIDWEKAAEELQQDYTALDFDGVTYYVR